MFAHVFNMTAIPCVSCVLVVSFTREDRAASFQVLQHQRIGVTGTGARQPTIAEQVTYWTT
jgi:hypothetical protein